MRDGRDSLPEPVGSTRHEDRLVGVFMIGVVLFNPLIIKLFDMGAAANVLGAPLLYVYLFGAWAVLIALMAVIAERTLGAHPPDDESSDGGDTP